MQTFHQWQQSPLQGSIPSKPQPTDWERQALTDDLNTALMFLQAACDAAQKANLKDSHFELSTAIADALSAVVDALERVDDEPDV